MQKIRVKSENRMQMIDITSRIETSISHMNLDYGLCMIFVPHTTAAVTINESADPSVCRDIQNKLDDVIPRGESLYSHFEGNSDAHIKASLVGASELVIVEEGRPVLGRWQGIFFCEFDGPRSRTVYIESVQ